MWGGGIVYLPVLVVVLKVSSVVEVVSRMNSVWTSVGLSSTTARVHTFHAGV